MEKSGRVLNNGKKRLSSGIVLTSLKQKELSKENEPPNFITDLETNNDEEEKRKRRISKLFQSNSTDDNVSHTLLPQNKKTITASKGGLNQHLEDSRKKSLSNEELSELYSNCIKLCTENRINQKNTWDLNLIEYIEDVIEVQQEDGNATNFQTASCTLDASVKIYACRVDSVHMEMFKVLGGLNRTEDTADSKENVNADSMDAIHTSLENRTDADDDEDESGKKPSKKSKRVTGCSTIETNLENINAKKFDLQFDVDPLFKKTSATFDEGGSRGLLLNHLSVYNHCEIIFDSRDIADDSVSSKQWRDDFVDISVLQGKLVSIIGSDDIHSLQICPTYANFEFPNEREDQEKKSCNSEELSDTEVPGNDFPEEEEDGFGNEEFIQENERTLMQEISVQDAEETCDGTIEMIPYFDSLANPMAIAMTIGSENSTVLDGVNEFDYFNKKAVQNWAGPSHWKFRTSSTHKDQQQANGVSNNIDEKKKGRKPKEPFYIDFSETYDDIDESLFAAPARATTILSEALLKKSINTLPMDIHYDAKMLTQLFNKPLWRVSLAKRRKTENDAHFPERQSSIDHVQSSGYESDSGLGFAGVIDEDDLNNGDSNDAVHLEDEDEKEYFLNAPTIETDIELVKEPRKVEKIKMNYAKSAKVVDIKALKDAVWSELCETMNPKEIISKDSADRKSVKSQTSEIELSTVLAHIPNRVSKEALHNISVPFCFICLLHLANEKSLFIRQEKGNLSELFISNIQPNEEIPILSGDKIQKVS